MPTFKQKNVIKSYKLRLQEKLKTVTEETENATSFLNNRIEEFRKRVQQILEIKDEKCLSLYRKLSSDLESFSEKLYVLQASFEEASDEESGSSENDEDSVKFSKSEENSRASSQRESPSCFSENSLNVEENAVKESQKNIDKNNAVEYQINVPKCTGESISHRMCSKENVSQPVQHLEESLEVGHCSERNLNQKHQVESINQSVYVENIRQQRHLERNESELTYSQETNQLTQDPVYVNLQRHFNTSVSQKLHFMGNAEYAGHDEHRGSITDDDFYSLNSDSNVKNTNSFTQFSSDLVNLQKEFISGNTISSNASVSQSSCYHSISSSINESLMFPKENRNRSDNTLVKTVCSSQLSDAPKVIPSTELEVSSQFPATLSYIIDPGNFWIQLENSDSSRLNFPKSEYDHVKSLAAIEKGDYCLAPYKSTYYRALSLSDGRSICEPIKVQFIDLGSIREVILYDIRPLPKPAYEIPAQAVHCYLYGIVPIENSWSDECIEKFKDYQSLNIETTVKGKGNLYGVQLVVKSSADLDLEEDISIDVAQSLCLDGLALSCDEFDIGQREIGRPELSKPVSHKAESSLEVSGSYDINAISSDSGVSITSAYKSSQISNQRSEIFQKVTEDYTLSVAVRKVLPYGDDSLDFQDKERKDVLFESCNTFNSTQSTSEKNSSDLLKSSRELPISSSCLLCKDKNFCLHLVVPSPSLLFVKEDMVIVMLSHIVSPQEFYVNMAMENSNLLDDLREQMTCTYESEKKLYPPKISNLSEGMFCAGRFVEDGYWYRVKIIRLSLEDKEKKQVLGQFIDYGNCEIIKSFDLRPLTPAFSKHPNFAIKCSLAGITPVKGVRSSNNLPWSDDAISVFKKLTSFDRCLTAQICSDLCNSENDGYPVLLWDTKDSKDLLINELLVAQKVALFDESFVEPPSSVHANEESQLDAWDPMAEEYSNDDNNYSYDDEDIEIVNTGYKSKDADYICKYFSMHGHCPKGSKCIYEHRPMLEDGLTYDKEEVYCFDNVLLIPEAVTNVLVQVSAIINPSHFYVVLPFGSKTVDDIDSLISNGSTYDQIINYEARALFLEVDQYYSSMPFRENTGLALACGTIVAAKRKWDDKWHRGRIIDVMDVNKPAKVFFLDSGDTEWVPRKFIKSMLPQYLYTPFQAVNCSLSHIEPVVSSIQESWTSDAINFFKEIVAGEILLAEIFQRSGDVYHISLRKTLKNNHRNIAQLLVSAGFAQYQPTRCSKKKSTVFVPG